VTRDGERAQVYAAELAAFDGTDLEEVVGFEEVRVAIEAVVATVWWPHGEVDVEAMNALAQSSHTRCSTQAESTPTIRLAGPQCTIATGAHELAHALAGVDHGHDAVFRRAHLDVVDVMTNADTTAPRGQLHVDQLDRAYAAAGLVIGRRTWPQPPSTGAIAL
jgi:predicted membrane-bound mannosyltransferase